MPHIRKQLRDRVITIVTGLPSTGSRVRSNRAIPKPRGEGTDIVVRTPREQSRDITMDGAQQRLIVLRLDLTAKATSEEALVDALDQSALEVEEAIAADIYFGGLAQQTEYRGAELFLSGEGEKMLGTLAISFEVTLLTRRGAPGAAA